MEKYAKINGFKKLDIIVIKNEKEEIYRGKVEECPLEIGELLYSKIQLGNPTTIYVFDEDYNEKD